MKIKYADDDFAVINYEEGLKYGKFTRYIPSNGKFVLVLPYVVNKGEREYLVKKERIYAWDSHADHSGLTMPLKYQPEVTACHIVKIELGVDVKENDFMHLGMTFSSKYSEDSYYLFSIELNKKDILLSDELVLVKRSDIVRGLDPILMMATARLEKIMSSYMV